MKPPEILFDLHCGKKFESNPHILKDDFRKMQSRYKNYQQIYTDGSKEDSRVGCAVISSINKYVLEEWQTSWNNSIGNRLLDIKPTIGEYQSVVRNI